MPLFSFSSPRNTDVWILFGMIPNRDGIAVSHSAGDRIGLNIASEKDQEADYCSCHGAELYG